jgi:hypothetical protein
VERVLLVVEYRSVDGADRCVRTARAAPGRLLAPEFR